MGKNGHSSSFKAKIGSFLSLIIVLLSCIWSAASECEFKFISRLGGPQNGTFTAPSLNNPTNITHVCVYTFIAAHHQKVQISFTSFTLRGTPPECKHEYLDLFAEIKNPDTTDLINAHFNGRFCGLIPPRSRISLYRTIAFSFYTDKTLTTQDIFTGTYEFINDTDYQTGTPAPNTPCTFTVTAKGKRKGMILSPTYPGAYPQPLFCSYLFSGKPTQRVHLEFRDFDLFSGGTHCPFDVVTVYDGRNSSYPVIGTYCGQHRNLIIYSTVEYLYVTFSVIDRIMVTQNRGFKGFYEFSESFVKLDFIGKNGGEHIRGSECDQKILSRKESSGFVFSPNYPFPFIPKTVCRYFIYGMKDNQDLERVRLEFLMFDIPKGDETKEECNDRYLKIYLKGQETTDSYDKFDYEYCGNMIPETLVSEGPRLVMMFASGDSQGRGFKAKYTFETEYLIPGTPAPEGGCSFIYQSSGGRMQGEFNSPRFPANYPSSTNCTFLFLTNLDEQVSIIFNQFKIRADSANMTKPQTGEIECHEDWLEIYNIYRNDSENKIGRYCGVTSPGPLNSVRGSIGLKIVFRTDEKLVYSGFKAHYSFENAKSIFGDCGGSITNMEDGIIESPNFPIKYVRPSGISVTKTCNWHITVKTNYQILLNFSSFILEGDPITRGCSAAVVRLWLNIKSPPIEICGEKTPNDTRLYWSDSNYARISFVVADKSAGAEGFQLIWTELSVSPDNCPGFQCAVSGYCIPKKLHCNNVTNCGENDISDEYGCVVEMQNDWMVKVVVGAVCAICILLLILCLFCQRKRHKRRHVIGHLPPVSAHSFSGHQHVCDDLGQRFASIDSV